MTAGWSCPAALLGDELVELLLHERVEPAGGLVEDQQLRPVEERLDQADFLPVAAREVADRSVEIGGEALARARPNAQARASRAGRRSVG